MEVTRTELALINAFASATAPTGETTGDKFAFFFWSQARRMEFYPLAFTTFGAPCKKTEAFSKRLDTYTRRMMTHQKVS